MANLTAVLTNHTANLIAYFLSAAFRDHLAGGVIADLGSILTSHTTDFVTNFLGLALRHLSLIHI